MSLHRLLFDTTAPGDSSNVGAYLRSSTGTLLTHTTVGGDEALDINIAQSVSLTVTATNLDIRDLAHATDSVKLGDGTTLYTGTTVGGDHGLDVNLITANVNVNLQDGAGTDLTSTLAGAKQALDVNIAASDIEINVEDDKANVAVAAAAESVTTTSAALVTSILAARKFIWIYNNGNKNIYLGPSGVSTSSGYPVFPGSEMCMRLGPAIALHSVTDSGTQNTRILQAS